MTSRNDKSDEKKRSETSEAPQEEKTTEARSDARTRNLPAVIPQAASQDLPALTAGLMHEVKNPLAAIHLHLQLLEGYVTEIQEDEDLKDRIQDKVGYIKNEILNLNQSLQNLLRLIRAEKVGEFSAVDLNSLAREVVIFLEPQALREGIELVFESGLTDERTRMDPAFIKQILINLIINSIQAFEKSNRSPEERKIVVSVGRQRALNYVRVADNGPGMSPETQEKIFDAFYSTRSKGSGLGLALVQRMIAAMDGHLELLSEPGEGTQFTVYLRGEEPASEGMDFNSRGES